MSKCELTDLTVAPAGVHADVLRVTPLGRHDSSYVYFVAGGVLTTTPNARGEVAVPGVCKNRDEEEACNLYLWNGEKTTFIAAGVSPGGRLSDEQTSPDGKWLAFESEKSLTGYGNAAPNGEFVNELFLYSAATGQLVCASCNPTDEPPIAGGGGGVAHFPLGDIFEETFGVFSSRHLLTDAGKVFFETYEALVPADTNGKLDVYEYEGGRVQLISSGTSSFESNLEGASESGNDVFFRSDQQLVPQDSQEGMIVIYDARVVGGFPAVASLPACTTADACRTPVSPQPSIYGAPASQTFSGLGNLAPPEAKPKAKPKAKPVKCKKDFVKKKGKCVKKTAKKAKKSAHANRRGK